MVEFTFEAPAKIAGVEITRSKILNSPPGLAIHEVGVQLWSVKEDIAKDFKGVIGKLPNMGFDGVEFASVDGKTMWDRIAQGTTNSLVMQLDVSQAKIADQIPARCGEKVPGGAP